MGRAGRQPGSLREIYCSWCLVVKTLVSSFVVVELEVFSETYVCFVEILVGLEKYILVLHGAP